MTERAARGPAGETLPNAATWNEVLPPELPPLTAGQKIRGAVRLAAFVATTLLALGLFVAGRYLRHWFGHRVTFHFLAARQWARIGLRLAGLRHDTRGVPVRGGAVVANHCSWLDIMALRAVTLMYFVSKAEVADWPGVGFVTRVTGTIFIERRRSQAKAQEEMLRSRIAADQLLTFFPEGTSTDGERVLPFKSSLFSVFFLDGHGAGLAVQPVSIRYRPAEGSGLPASFYGWWGTMGFERHVFDVFARSRGGRVTVIFHPAVRASEFPDRKALADHCQRTVAEGHAAS